MRNCKKMREYRRTEVRSIRDDINNSKGLCGGERVEWSGWVDVNSERAK